MSQGLLFFSHFHASLFRKMNSLLYNCRPLHRVNTYTVFYDLESKDIRILFSPNEMRTLSISCYMFKILIFIFNMVVKKKFFFLVYLISVSPDVNLEPYVTYEYRISAWNSYGPGFSRAVRTRTKEDLPEGVSPPRWTRAEHLDDAIVLHWRKPVQSNGMKLFWKVKKHNPVNA